MYVVPFCMGPLGSKISALGVEITDSAYVAISMRIMTRMGKAALDQLGEDGFFVPAVHTLGAPLAAGQKDVPWPCNDDKYIVHFPETREIWSYGSGYGGNALLGKKCYALRIASVMARDEGWLAEHMLILKLTSPEGDVELRRRRLPLAPAARPTWPCCSRRSPAGRPRPSATTSPGCASATMAASTPSTRKPASSASRRAPAATTNKNALDDAARQHRLHQRRPDRRRRRLVGRPDRRRRRAGLTDWQGRAWTPDSGEPAAHPNARFTVPAGQCPVIAPEWEDPTGVPISAILFGGRRASAVPLVTEAFDWEHGVFLASNVASEGTAAAENKVGELRRDPFAMLPFCGYNMGDYFAPLAEDRRSADARQAAAHLLRQLVPQGRERQVRLAGLRRQQPAC